MTKLLDQALDIITDTLYHIKSKQDMRDFLEDLLTPQEWLEISERIQLVKQLLNGKTQRDVASDLGISITTVNRWARMIKYGTGSFTKLLQS